MDSIHNEADAQKLATTVASPMIHEYQYYMLYGVDGKAADFKKQTIAMAFNVYGHYVVVSSKVIVGFKTL